WRAARVGVLEGGLDFVGRGTDVGDEDDVEGGDVELMVARSTEGLLFVFMLSR
ncbi:MAG: hypothetical protein L6R39_005573, partial [Caloplaca ligustica]